MAEQQTTWQTTDEDIAAIRARMDGLDFVPTERLIQYHQLIQARRLADAAERQAVALEIIAEVVAGANNRYPNEAHRNYQQDAP